jgi:hypothetical protein
MARKKRQKIRDEDVTGLKYFHKLRPLLARLHEVGCGRDRAGNRQLHMDEYCMLVLLYLFNPVVRSLRAIQQASGLRKVQQKLGCPRASLGSLSEATEVFDPERLKEIIAELGQELKPLGRDPRLADIRQTLTLVDGTLLGALPLIAEASLQDPRAAKARCKWRLHTHFEVDRYLPTRMDLTDGRNTGKADERAVLRRTLQADCCYVMDRGYVEFTLFNAIVRAGSSYVCRLRDKSCYEVLEEHPLNEAAREADVVFDGRVRLGFATMKEEKRPDHPHRLVIVRITPHQKRGRQPGGTCGPRSDGYLRIATNLIDVPAEVIALIYRYRWAIEVFFRFFKHLLGCRHLLSHDPVGIEIQTYCAIIACMLISLWTGRKPTLRTYEMICHYLIGWAEEDELLAHLAKLQGHDTK